MVDVVVMARIREVANKDRRLGRGVHGIKALFKYFSNPGPTFRERTLNVNVLTFKHSIAGKKCKTLTNLDHNADDSTSSVRSIVLIWSRLVVFAQKYHHQSIPCHLLR